MKKFNEMSNQEISLEKITLENEYNAVKNKISKLLDQLDFMDKQYIALNNELKRREK